MRAYPANDLVLLHFTGIVDGAQLEAALIAQARAMMSASTIGMWDVLGVDHLNLPPDAFEHLLYSLARTVRLRRPGPQAVVATDVVSLSIAHLIRRRARRFGMRIEVTATIDAACRALCLPHSPPASSATIRAASGGAS